MTWLVRLLRIARRQWFWMAAGILLGVLVILANTLLMAVSGWFIASMAISGSSGVAFNYFIPSGSIRFLAIARTVGRYAERLVTHEATFRVLSDLRVWLFNRLIPLAPARLECYAGGDAAGRLRADVDALETLYLRIVAPLATGVLSITAALIFLFYYSLPSAMAMALFLLLAALVLPLLVQRLSDNPGKQSSQLTAELRNRVTEGVQGAEELILFGAVERQAAVVDVLSGKLITEQERLGRINGVATGGMALFAGFAVAAVLLTASMQVSAHQLPPANLVMLLLFSAAIFEAAGQFPAALHLLPAAKESAARIFDLADAAIPVADPQVSAVVPKETAICFNSVTLGYIAGKTVRENISFKVPAGGTVVLTGSSGSGKSLLLETLLRFRNYEGSITIGGVEISELSKELLNGMISALPQKPHLFNGTIRDNILLGNEFATEVQLQQVLSDCCLDVWLAGLPLGLDTVVESNGSSVSGGEIRRIALARALLKDALILLLDEPTEGLDPITEGKVIANLRERFQRTDNITRIIVSHRPACMALGNVFMM